MHPATDDLSNAFVQLQHSLHGYLRRHLPDPALADDLLQEVFAKALISKRAGRRIDNLGGWLYAATRTTLVDYFRSTRTSLGPLDVNMAMPEPDDPRLHQELSNCLRPFIEQLPPLYSDTLIATELEGVTMRDLAETQGVLVSAIKSRAMRARAKLKELLLACCRVEMVDGLVSDYHRNNAGSCGGNCA